MYKIKQIPEDFIVKEINSLQFSENGDYSYFLLKKRNYNTLKAIYQIAKKLNIKEKNIGFAGNKDRNALTEQVISVFNFNRNLEDFNLKDLELKYLGRGKEKIYLGNLIGNGFFITIRNLNDKDIKKIKNKVKNNQILMPNFFGPQRFSSGNSEIGKNMIKRNFQAAVALILKSNTDYNEKIKQHLSHGKNDFIGALRLIPSNLLKLYIHSYQSFLFNKTLEQYIKINKKSIKIDKKSLKTNNKINNKKSKNGITELKLPIIGFGTELDNTISNKIIKKIMEEENLNARDFIMPQIPELSSESNEREAFIKVNDFEIVKHENDELNEGKQKMVVKFSLSKGCYATVLIDFLFD